MKVSENETAHILLTTERPFTKAKLVPFSYRVDRFNPGRNPWFQVWADAEQELVEDRPAFTIHRLDAFKATEILSNHAANPESEFFDTTA